VRRISRRQQVFVEPFVTFNFGQSPTTLPGASSGDALSTHSYAADPAHESSVADESVAAAERDGAALLVTEFGATTDVTTLRRVIDGLDTRGVSWAFWAYNEELIRDRSRPAGLEVLASRPTFDALVEPYPLALTGVPETGHWDPATRSYTLTYAAGDPRGRRYPASTQSVLWVPRLHYPDGYRVDVVGATVTSPPCAERLTLRTRRSATEVHVVVTPGAACG
jgi:endoglycosylceramidase